MSIDLINVASDKYTEAIKDANDIFDPSREYPSVQYAFAYLQLEFAEVNRIQVSQKIADLEMTQQTSYQLNDAASALRNIDASFKNTLQQESKVAAETAFNTVLGIVHKYDGSNTDAIITELDQKVFDLKSSVDPAEVATRNLAASYIELLRKEEALKIANVDIATLCPASVSSLTQENINAALDNVSKTQETFGSKLQTMMIFAQEDLGQYNAFLQGASATISKAGEITSTIARNV